MQKLLKLFKEANNDFGLDINYKIIHRGIGLYHNMNKRKLNLSNRFALHNLYRERNMLLHH